MHEGTTVERVGHDGDRFVVATDQGHFAADEVVVATGWCDRPAVPPFARCVSSDIVQVTPSQYRRPDDLPEGGVLVVGASATGTQLADEIHRSGRPVTELLSFRKGRAEGDEDARLGIPRGGRIVRVENLLALGGKPVIFDKIALPAVLFPGLDEDTFGRRPGTIYGLYEARYGINVIRISERLSAAAAPARVAALLGMKSGTPALVIRRVAYTYDDTPVEFRASWVNTQAHEYLSDLWKNEAR